MCYKEVNDPSGAEIVFPVFPKLIPTKIKLLRSNRNKQLTFFNFVFPFHPSVPGVRSDVNKQPFGWFIRKLRNGPSMTYDGQRYTMHVCV